MSQRADTSKPDDASPSDPPPSGAEDAGADPAAVAPDPADVPAHEDQDPDELEAEILELGAEDELEAEALDPDPVDELETEALDLAADAEREGPGREADDESELEEADIGDDEPELTTATAPDEHDDDDDSELEEHDTDTDDDDDSEFEDDSDAGDDAEFDDPQEGDAGSKGSEKTTSTGELRTRASSQDPELLIRRSRLMRKNRELRTQKTRLAIAFGVVATLLSIGLAATTVRMLNGFDREDQLAAELDHSRAETKLAESALAASREQVSELVRNRIPGVRPVKYDSVISIGEHSVRNLTFTVTRTLRDVSYEVRAVVENDTKRTIEPRLDLVFLGPLGLELGRLVVGESDNGEKSRGAMLPGEVRSFTSAVSLKRGEEPAFFLLQSR